MAPSRAVIALSAAQSRVFGTAHNPQGLRTGSRILKQRLLGPSMLSYYPTTVSIASIRKSDPALAMLKDAREEQRLVDVERKKTMGKGPPKKGEGRRAAMKGKKK